MNYIKLKARAKINLTLDVLGKREDGYHDLKMIMQTVSLYDGVYMKKIEKGKIKVKSNLFWLPADERNLAHKAAKLLIDEFKLDNGIFIELNKQIPVAAGLAGGSSDCAAVLVGMNKLYQLKIPKNKLMEYGARLGSDVPYCILRGTALAEGVGDFLTKLPECPFCYVVLVKPPVSVSTAKVFRGLHLENIKERPQTEKMISCIEKKDIPGIGKYLCNVLENEVIPKYPEIKKVKEELMLAGAAGSIMSGSGPTVFGLFLEKEKALIAAERIREIFTYKDIFVTTMFENRKIENCDEKPILEGYRKEWGLGNGRV